jgi:hypothetical protein
MLQNQNLTGKHKFGQIDALICVIALFLEGKV